MEFKYDKKTFRIDGISANDHIYQIICSTKSFYEADLLKYMRFIVRRRRKNNSIGIDVGANIGNHSVFFGNFLCDCVISIEPNNRVHSVLLNNLNNNNIHFTLYKCAVGNRERTGKIVVNESLNNIGASSVASGEALGSEGDVDIKTLDYLLNDYLSQNAAGDVAFIKIDVEGMELEVLQGATGILNSYKPDLFVETSSAKQLLEVESYLREFSYRRLTRHPFALTPVHHFAHKPTFSLKFASYNYCLPINIKNAIKNYLKRS